MELQIRNLSNWFHAYRKGPFAIYALDQYIGSRQVDAATARLFDEHRSGKPPLPTSLDFYKELKARDTGSLRQFLADLFETNTFWELVTNRVTARETETGEWEVTLEVNAHKTVFDIEGEVTYSTMDDRIEIGVFAAGKDRRRRRSALSRDASHQVGQAAHHGEGSE